MRILPRILIRRFEYCYLKRKLFGVMLMVMFEESVDVLPRPSRLDVWALVRGWVGGSLYWHGKTTRPDEHGPFKTASNKGRGFLGIIYIFTLCVYWYRPTLYIHIHIHLLFYKYTCSSIHVCLKMMVCSKYNVNMWYILGLKIKRYALLKCATKLWCSVYILEKAW